MDSLLENVCSTNTSNPSFSTKVFSEITPSTESPAKLFQELLNKKTDQNLSRILLVALMHIFSKFKEENSHANFYEYLKSLDPIKIEKLRITASSAFYKTFLNKYPEIGSVSFLQERIKKLTTAGISSETISMTLEKIFLKEKGHALVEANIYSKLGLAIAASRIDQSFQKLFEELQQHPLLVVGRFNDAYKTPPRQFEIIQGNPIFGWPKGSAQRVSENLGHAVVLIGAKKSKDLITGKEQQIVYYLNPNQNQTPMKDRMIFCMSYSRFQSSLANSCYRLVQDDSKLAPLNEFITNLVGCALYKP